MKYIDKYQNQNFEGVLRTILLLQWMIFSVPVSNVHKLSDQQKSIQGLIKRSWTLACDSQRLHLKIWFCFISKVFISPHKLIILWLSVFSGLITVYSQTMINLHELVFGLVKREYMDPWAQCSVLTTRYTLKIMYIYSWVY